MYDTDVEKLPCGCLNAVMDFFEGEHGINVCV